MRHIDEGMMDAELQTTYDRLEYKLTSLEKEDALNHAILLQNETIQSSRTHWGSNSAEINEMRIGNCHGPEGNAPGVWRFSPAERAQGQNFLGPQMGYVTPYSLSYSTSIHSNLMSIANITLCKFDLLTPGKSQIKSNFDRSQYKFTSFYKPFIHKLLFYYKNVTKLSQNLHMIEILSNTIV